MTKKPEELRQCSRGCVWDAAEENEEPRPKSAKHGQLCNSCFFRLTAALKLIPDLMANMRAQLSSFGAQKLSERVSGGGDGSPAPLNIGPLDASDALFAKLHSWVAVFSEALHVNAPAIPSWANDREVQGSRPVSVEAAHMLAAWLSDWLTDRLEDIAASPSAVAFHDDLCYGWEDSRGVFSLSAAYGVEPRPVHDAEKRECPICGAREVFVKLPNNFDPDVEVMCGRCEWVAEPGKQHAQLITELAG
jgi:hypothetical protein